MVDLNHCFVCDVTIMPGRARKIEVRSMAPDWKARVACPVCRKKLDDCGETTIFKYDEHWSVRPTTGAPV